MTDKFHYDKGFHSIYSNNGHITQNMNVQTRPNVCATYSLPIGGANASSHINVGFQQDGSDSGDSESSQSESESASDPEWIENVGEKGDLFYVESRSGKEDASGKSTPSRESRKSHTGRSDQTNLNENRIHLFQTSSGRTYQSSEGDIKEITISVDSQKHNYGRRTTLCETLLGIIPGEVPDNRLGSSNWDSRKNRIIVKGLAPDGEVMKSKNVRIGDYLKCINSTEITAENLSQVLMKINAPCKVKLQIQSGVGNAQTKLSHIQVGMHEKDTIVKYITRTHSSFEDVVAIFQRTPHLFLFIRDSSNSSDVFEDGVIYKHPKYENKLLTLTGAFITLNQMSIDVTGGDPLSSSLVVDDYLVHVAYHRENRDTVILAVPASYTTNYQVHQILMNIVKVLKWQFESLNRAFSDQANLKTLDQLFVLFFHNILTQHQDSLSRSCKEYLDAIPLLSLNPDTQVQIDNVLGELESGDFGDMSEAYYDEQRLYLITGSCLFYKGWLCRTHLHKDDLTDIYLYCYHHQLLSLIKQEEVGQLIVWREVFPSRLLQNLRESSNLDFKEYKGRWFVLLIAINNCLIGVLLKSGGCTSNPEQHPSPDPFYVDQTKNTLLRISNSGLANVLEKVYQNGSGPDTVSVDAAATKAKDAKKIFTKQQILNLSRSSSLQTLSTRESTERCSTSQSNLLSSSPHRKQEVSTVLKKRIQSHLEGEKQQLLSHLLQTDGESEFDRTSDRNDGSSLAMESSIQTSSSDADSRTSSEDIYRGLKSNRIYGTTFDLSSLRTELENEDYKNTNKLVSGCDNTLFQCLTLNTSEGVLIMSLQESQQQGPLHLEVIKNFQRCVSEIHNIFQSTLKVKEPVRNSELFRNDRGIFPIKEHGVLFELSPPNNSSNKKVQNVAYWVVGRIFQAPEQKEVYVCFQDGASQNAIEMAFKLSFGTLV